jgi:hypothetical protein
MTDGGPLNSRCTVRGVLPPPSPTSLHDLSPRGALYRWATSAQHTSFAHVLYHPPKPTTSDLERTSLRLVAHLGSGATPLSTLPLYSPTSGKITVPS